MVWQYVPSASQFTFGENVAVAEILLVHRHGVVAISVPYHFAPMVAMAVDGAAIVEDNPFNSF